MRDRIDVVVAGGGPAGLALAAGAARRGLRVVLVERRAFPVDKACGEGILPAGVRALEALGVLAGLRRAGAAPISAVRWIEPGAGSAAVTLPAPGGLGVRRTALSDALAAAAIAAGATLVAGEVAAHRRGPDGVEVDVEPVAPARRRTLRAALLVAADGLASPIRRREGLDRPVAGPPRLAVRRHFATTPWSDEVEVWLGAGIEAYVTPVGPRQVGVALLLDPPGGPYARLLARLPALAARLAGAAPASVARGAGPLARAAAGPVLDRLVLLGDAAGYVDALTGEGISMALGCAADLAALLPDALARGATAAALAPYARAWARRYRAYAAWTRAALWLVRHPRVRRRALRLAGSRPDGLRRLVAVAIR